MGVGILRGSVPSESICERCVLVQIAGRYILKHEEDAAAAVIVHQRGSVETLSASV